MNDVARWHWQQQWRNKGLWRPATEATHFLNSGVHFIASVRTGFFGWGVVGARDLKVKCYTVQ